MVSCMWIISDLSLDSTWTAWEDDPAPLSPASGYRLWFDASFHTINSYLQIRNPSSIGTVVVVTLEMIDSRVPLAPGHCADGRASY